MKKVLILLILFVGFNSNAQSGRIITIENDTIMTYGTVYFHPKNITYKNFNGDKIEILKDSILSYSKVNNIEYNKNSPGYHIEKAGEFQNKSMAMMGLSTSAALFVMSDNQFLYIIGGGIGLGCTITAIVFKARANNHLKKAGLLMQKEL